MKVVKYDAMSAVRYAERWALDRNPAYYNFDSLGGDCTAFASQCLYAGSGTMNYTPTYGWYYNSLNDRSPAWSGVEYFYRFLMDNHDGVGDGSGPFGIEISPYNVGVGDFVQLGNGMGTYYHTLMIVGMRNGEPLIASHTYDAYNRRLGSYNYNQIRAIKILGVRKY